VGVLLLLQHQILIFADKELSMRAENLVLPPKVAGDKPPELTVFFFPSMRAENLVLPPKVAGNKPPELTVFVCRCLSW